MMILKSVFIIAIVAVAMIVMITPSSFAVENAIKVQPNWKSEIELKVTDFNINRISQTSTFQYEINYYIYNPNPSPVVIYLTNTSLFETSSSDSKLVCTGVFDWPKEIESGETWSSPVKGICSTSFKDLYDNHPEVWYSIEENTSTWKMSGNTKYIQKSSWDGNNHEHEHTFKFILPDPTFEIDNTGEKVLGFNLMDNTSDKSVNSVIQEKIPIESSSSQSKIDNKIGASSYYGDRQIIWDGASGMSHLSPVLDESVTLDGEPNAKQTNSELIVVDDSMCGRGTTIEDGKCVAIISTEEGGGCLIATATYGSEMATEVQQLRELRDNQLLNTESGTAFMGTFNDIYYSFSPIIADYERENPYFKEAVKLAITPMISSLSLMDNANSESEVISLGLSVIMLNIGMYLGVPAVVIVGIRKRF
jgi:hypothetical protein